MRETQSDMQPVTSEQRRRFEAVYAEAAGERWWFHYSDDPLVRFLRDRRLRRALQHISSVLKISAEEMHQWRVLVVCGGVGGEGTFLMNEGFTDVTVSDFSENSLGLCRQFDQRLKTSLQNAEDLEFESSSYDLVLVQDGLHHLSRPVLGLTEMLRVSRRIVVVIEPHLGTVSRLLGTKWEYSHGNVNYVFRWNQPILEQATRSYLLSGNTYVKAIRFWDHNLLIGKLAKRAPRKHQVRAAKFMYGMLDVFLPRAGNMMVGVIAKEHPPELMLAN